MLGCTQAKFILLNNCIINFKTLFKMKNFDLNNYGVQEMNAVEIREIDGGALFITIGMIAVGSIMAGVIIERIINY